MITGDAVGANGAAVRRVLECFSRLSADGITVLYSLVCWVCSSHLANLAVHVAIVGGLVQKPEDRDPLVCNASRWFKYLLHDYSEDYAMSLRLFLAHGVELTSAPHPAGKAFTAYMQQLHGPGVLPADVVEFFDGALSRRRH
eukprot:579088-Pyramimonas_sp.AAC.1